MKIITILLLVCIGIEIYSSAISKGSSKTISYSLEDAANIFDDFVTKFTKVYKSADERNKRYNTFKDNLNKINELNNGSDISYDINQFSDHTYEEFKEMYLTPMYDYANHQRYVESKYPSDLPIELDYRLWGFVSSVKDQGSCGAGYAFAAAGTVEGQYAKNFGELSADMSAQQVIDCNNYNMECRGGLADLALSSLPGNHGVMLEEDYPYAMRAHEECHVDRKSSEVELAGSVAVKIYNDDTLKIALYELGPLAVDIGVCHAFALYSGGIFNKPCNGQLHSVLVVGYGFENGETYWLIKNSWGTTWGEKGYMRISPLFRWEYAYCGILKM